MNTQDEEYKRIRKEIALWLYDYDQEKDWEGLMSNWENQKEEYLQVAEQILNIKVAGGYSIADLIISANTPVQGRIVSRKKRPDLVIE